MPQNLLAVHGVIGLVVCVGEGGRILHFAGDLYQPTEPVSPTRGTLRGVAVVSPTEAWAVGDEGIYRWDGRTWHAATLAARHEGFSAVWAHPESGVWFAGRRSLLNWQGPGHGGLMVHTDTPLRAVWGSGPRDVWFLAEGRVVMRWDGEGCQADELPGDPDEEWNAIAGGGPDEPVFVVGPSGFMMEYSRKPGWYSQKSGWYEVSTDTSVILTGACFSDGDLYVTTDTGLIRQWDGRRWRTVAFSAFGALHAVTVVDRCVWACGAKGSIIQHQPDDGGRKE